MNVFLGVDPGLASLGWGLVWARGHALEHLAHGVIRTTPDHGPDHHRAVLLARELVHQVRRASCPRPVLASIEQWAWYGEGSGQASHAMGLAIGAVCTALEGVGIPVEVARRAQDWRHRLGLKTTASKAEVAERVRVLLRLAAVPRPEHAADALALAVVATGQATQLALASGE